MNTAVLKASTRRMRPSPWTCTRLPLSSSTVLNSELEKFSRLGGGWWDANGKGGVGPLHKLNLCRVRHIVNAAQLLLAPSENNAKQLGKEYMKSASTPLQSLRVLDVGCGGGLLCESLARLGADVLGVDPCPENVDVAQSHARGDPLTRDICYEVITAEDLASRDGAYFDMVCALEVIEHVSDPNSFVSTISRLVRPGGIVTLSTINRTTKDDVVKIYTKYAERNALIDISPVDFLLRAYLIAILGAEYTLGLVPPGTHDWQKFISPLEMEKMLDLNGLVVERREGMVYDPSNSSWSLDRKDLDVNYICTSSKVEEVQKQ